MTKRILNRLTLTKIAAVDDPCQAHATVAIMKVAPKKAPTGPRAIAKATFQEALEGNMIAGAVAEAFYDSFDGLWERNDAFREALTDELSAGGDGSVASAAYVESVKALVDTAVAEARNAGATAADTDPIEKAFTDAATSWLESRQQETKTVIIIKSKAALVSAIAKFDPAKTSVEDRDCIVQAATDLGLESELPVEGPLAKAAEPAQNDETKVLKRQVAVLSLSPIAKAHFDGLDEAGQTAFLAKDAAAQTAEIEAKNSDDPVIYKTASGREIRKSHGQLAADLARDNDELRGDITKLKETGTGDLIAKRLLQYPNVAKAVAEPLIKSALAMTDTAEQTAVFSSLDAMNKSSAGLFKRVGSAGGGTPTEIEKGAHDPDSALGRMDTIVKRIAKDDNISIAKATVKAVETDEEYQAAYAESLENVPVVGSPAAA